MFLNSISNILVYKIISAKQNLKYKIFQVNYKLPNCESFQLSTAATGTTGFGVPDPVTTTYVNQSLNQCKVFWQYNSSHSEIEEYWVNL